MENKIVKISLGEVTLIRPTAGVRNKAAIIADTPTHFKQSVFKTELLPYCITDHPFGVGKTLRESLDCLTTKDYDLLIDAMEELLQDGVDIKKKSISESDQSTETENGK